MLVTHYLKQIYVFCRRLRNVVQKGDAVMRSVTKCFFVGLIFVVFSGCTSTRITSEKQNETKEPLASFQGTIKQVLVNAMNPSDVRIRLVEYPRISFETNLWDAVRFGLIEQKPLNDSPFFSTYKTLDCEGWKTKLLCKKRGDSYEVVHFEKVERTTEE